MVLYIFNLYRGVLILHIIDKICFLVICPLILITQIVVLITFKKYPQLRAKPGNIFLGLVIIEMMLNIHLLSNASKLLYFIGF